MSNSNSKKQLLYLFASLFTGVLFGIGLTVSQMVNPEKVLGFLDIFGQWDPALVFVMIGALVVSTLGFQVVGKMRAPVFALNFLLPTKKDIDRPLIVGAILFGIGWGMVGLCPGPAITSLVTLNTDLMIFLVAMAGGIFVQKRVFN